MINFNKLNLRQANQKRYRQWAPEGYEYAWPHSLDCGHLHWWTASQIDSNPKEGDAHYCSSCANGERTGFGDEGFYTGTVFHRAEQIGEPKLVPVQSE
jgi:hypothetical protein